MKKITILQIGLVLLLFFLASIDLNAQLKVGMNPKTLSSNIYFEVESIQGSKFIVTKDSAKVGIGTSNPSTKFEINNGTIPGAIKIIDGTEGLGKVLTSDATGLGVWAVPTVNASNVTNSKNLTNSNGIIVVGGTGATLQNTTLRLDSAAIAKMINQSPIKDSLLKVVNANTSVATTFNITTRVLTTTVNGVTSSVTIPNVNDSTTASNGLTLTGKDVRLGGTLTSATTITTSNTNTLALSGLQNGTSGDSLVSLGAGGVLRKVAVSAVVTGDNWGSQVAQVSAPLSGNGTSGSPLNITRANTTAANNLVTVTNGTNATFTAMTVGVDTTNLKSFLNNKITVSSSAPLSGNGTSGSPISLTSNNTTAGQLVTVTNGTGASLTNMQVGVDTTALKSFVNGRTTVSNAFNTSTRALTTTVNGITSNAVTIPTTNDSTTASNGLNINGKDVRLGGTLTSATTITTSNTNTLALSGLQNGTSGDSLVSLGAGGVLRKVAVSAVVTGDNWGSQVTQVSAPLTGNGTSGSPLNITRANTTAANNLVTVTNGTNATFTSMTVGVDTTNLKSFLNNNVTVSSSAPLTGNGTSGSPLNITRANTTAANNLVTVTNGINATFTAMTVGVDTTNLKSFINARTTNTLTASSNAITNTTNGIVATLTPSAGTLTAKFLGFDASGNLVTDSAITTATEPWMVQGGTTQATSNTQNIYQTGTVAIGKNAVYNDANTQNVRLDVEGNMHVGGNDTSNYIAFKGITGDNPSAYDHAYLGVRKFGGAENSEMVIFKGDNNSTSTTGTDRIRVLSGELQFQTYTNDVSGSFESVSRSILDTTRMIIRTDGNVGIGTLVPTSLLDVNGTARIRTLNSGASSDSIVTSDANGVLRRRSATSIISSGTTVSNAFNNSTRALTTTVNGITSNAVIIPNANDSTTVSNGLTLTGKDVRLGGALISATTIATSNTNTLALSGLQNGTSGDSLVSLGAGGVLRKVAVSAVVTGDNWGSQVAQVSAPLSGNGTSGSPLSVTRANTTAANNLVTVTNGTNATFTAMTVGVDTTNLKSFLNNKITVSSSAPLSGNGTSGSPLSLTSNNTTAGQLVTVTNGTGASLTNMQVGVDTTALKTFVNGRTTVSNAFNSSSRALTTTVNGITSNAVTIPTTNDSTTASNGLTLTGKDVRLGGTLTSATIINQGTNLMTFTGTPSSANSSVITLNNTAAGANGTVLLDMLTPNSDVSYYRLGKSTSFGNSAEITYRYTRDNSDSNSLSLGFFNSQYLVNLTKNGNLGIGANLFIPTQKLDVDGGARIRSLGVGASTDSIVTADVNGVLRRRNAATILSGATTNTLTSATNTMTNTTNGIAASASIINTNALSVSGNSLTSTINGIASNAATVPNIYTADGTLTGNRTVTQGANTLTFNTTPTADYTAGVNIYNNAFGNPGVTILNMVSPNSDTSFYRLGKILSGGNVAEISYTHRGNNNDSNRLSFGFHSSRYLLNLMKNGNLSIGNIIATEKLDVDGTARVRTLNAGASSDSIVTADANGVLRRRNVASIFSGATTNTLSSATNTMTNTTNGVAGSAPIINSNALSVSGNTLTSTINGVVSNNATISNIYTADGTLTGERTVTNNGNVLNFQGTGGSGFPLRLRSGTTTSSEVTLGIYDRSSSDTKGWMIGSNTYNGVANANGNLSRELHFATLGFANSGVKMKIDSAGNVGIGRNTDAAVRLAVQGGIAVGNGNFAIDSTYVQDNNFVTFRHNGTSEDFIGYRNNTFYFADCPGGSDITNPNVMVLGNLGLGNTTPAAKLHVTGNARITSMSLGAATDSIVVVDANGELKKRASSSVATSNQLSASLSATVPALSIGDVGSVTVTIAGAAVGDAVIVNPTSDLPAGVVIAYSRVSAANTIKIGFSGTGSSSAYSQTFDIKVIK